MIIHIGVILTIGEVKILVDFIQDSLGEALPLRKETIYKMQCSGMWEIYDSMRNRLKEEDE